MSSGIQVDAAAVSAAFELVKMIHTYQWYTFKVTDDYKRIIPDEFGVRSSYVGVDADKAAWADLVNQLPDDEPRYAVFDSNFIWNGKEKQRICFVSWSPEGARVKDKMVYTSSKDYLKKALQLECELQATNESELSYDNMIEKVSKGLKN